MNSIRPNHLDKATRTSAHTTANIRNASDDPMERGLYRAAMHLLVAGTVLWSLAVWAMVL